MSLWSLLANK